MTTQNSIFAPTPIAVNKGGTGNSSTPANGQLWVGNGTATPAIANLTAGTDISVTNGSGSITVNSTLPNPLTVARGGTSNSTALTNGQLWIGNTGNIPTIANLTAGTNIGITNAAGSITVGTTGPASWTLSINVTNSVTMSPWIKYLNNYNLGTVTFNLPSTGTLGDTFKIISLDQENFTIIKSGGPTLGSLLYNGTTGGRLTTTSFTACITLICTLGGASPRYSVESTNGELFTLTPS